MTEAARYVLATNFRDELKDIEVRLAQETHSDTRYFEAFSGIDDDLYGYLVQKQFNGFDRVKWILPDWASDEIRRDSTGNFTLQDSVIEALQFWRLVKERFEDLHTLKLRDCRVLDYGAGWGRVTRFCAKDVPAFSLYAIEPNTIFADIYAHCKVPGVLIRTDWESRNPIEVSPVDLIISFSILTHTSEELARNIKERWLELTKPGSVIAFTIRPGALLHDNQNEMAIFSEEERLNAQASYSRGELAYKPYPNSTHWGVTVMPMQYVHTLFGDYFEIHQTRMLLQNWTQLIVIMVRRSPSDTIDGIEAN